MAQRRMFSPDIVASDAFLDMPVSSQALYFHLGMNADDDGFVNPKRTMRIMGASEDDLKVLLAKRFLLPFESGVVVIKHWLIHNLIRKDRYKETPYIEEKASLQIKSTGSYTERQPNGNQMAPQVRLGKVRLGQVNTLSEAQAPTKSIDQLWNEMIEPYIGSLAPRTKELFENHWRAKNLKGTKERWQMEKVFDMGRRLATWKARDEAHNFEKSQRQQLKKVEEMPRERDRSGPTEGPTRISFNQE